MLMTLCTQKDIEQKRVLDPLPFIKIAKTGFRLLVVYKVATPCPKTDILARLL